jgi:hypothetical protein
VSRQQQHLSGPGFGPGALLLCVLTVLALLWAVPAALYAPRGVWYEAQRGADAGQAADLAAEEVVQVGRWVVGPLALLNLCWLAYVVLGWMAHARRASSGKPITPPDGAGEPFAKPPACPEDPVLPQTR